MKKLSKNKIIVENRIFKKYFLEIYYFNINYTTYNHIKKQR